MSSGTSSLSPPGRAGRRHQRDGTHLAFQPALDGLRGIAVLSVLAFHGGVSWAQGGFLGVEAFFVLSGFLITSLLLAEREATGRIRLGRFWGRRARRLLPALFCLVTVTGIEQALAGPAQSVPGFRADGISALAYYANWHQIFAGNGYFQQTALTSPLQHTWSLAIEEQFYLIWPLLLLAVLWLGGRLIGVRADGRGRLRAGGLGGRGSLSLLAAVSAAGAVASSVEMALLYHGGAGINRVYYGTDTRAQGLLTGALLAIVLAARRRHPAASGTTNLARPISVVAAAAGVLAAAGYLLACLEASGSSAWLYQGGFLGIDVIVAAVILASVSAVDAFSPVRWLLSRRPLRAVGLISYGLYLWHFPLFLWLTAQSTGANGAGLLFLRVGVTFTVSVASYYLVEQPIRRRRVPERLTRALAATGLAAALAAVLVGSAVAAAVPSRVAPLRSSPSRVRLEGNDPACRVQLPFLPIRLYKTFHTCPPARVLLVGDSVALTLGFELGIDEERYGVLLADRGAVGCGFVSRGQVDAFGTFTAQDTTCPGQLDRWRSDARLFGPQAVVVEMGWWDSMDHLWNGRVVHIGQPAFDSYFLDRVRTLVGAVAPRGQPVVLLSVPWMSPAPWPNGELPPGASPARHREINALLAKAAASSHGQVDFFDLSPYVTPLGRFQADVGGSICRESDGIHFYVGSSLSHIVPTYCGERVQAALFTTLRRLVASARGR
ncbi:MAG: acyltransferase family protein [Actinomycetota bacterium]|nr:acyltransferase family protein [Actinomycetota bacterium]